MQRGGHILSLRENFPYNGENLLSLDPPDGDEAWITQPDDVPLQLESSSRYCPSDGERTPEGFSPLVLPIFFLFLRSLHVCHSSTDPCCHVLFTYFPFPLYISFDFLHAGTSFLGRFCWPRFLNSLVGLIDRMLNSANQSKPRDGNYSP